MRAIQLTPYSTVDELQILQVDEFQLPELAGRRANRFLHEFAISEWSQQWNDVRRVFKRRATGTIGKEESFFAVPYYDNVGVLAYRSNLTEDVEAFRDIEGLTWETIAKCTEKWEAEEGGERKDEVYFFFNGVVDENYNCLFFEILTSLVSAEQRERGKDVEALIRCFTSREGLSTCALFYTCAGVLIG